VIEQHVQRAIKEIYRVNSHESPRQEPHGGKPDIVLPLKRRVHHDEAADYKKYVHAGRPELRIF
jgi:hypothetical protein